MKQTCPIFDFKRRCYDKDERNWNHYTQWLLSTFTQNQNTMLTLFINSICVNQLHLINSQHKTVKYVKFINQKTPTLIYKHWLLSNSIPSTKVVEIDNII